MTQITKLFLFCTLLLTTLNYASAQQPVVDTLQTLEQRYSEILRTSETYQDKKVIRRSSLNMFWAALSDTVATAQESLKAALADKMDIAEKLRESEGARNGAEEQLQSSLGENSKISFLGINFSQSLYNVLVWGLIIVFGVMAGMFFQRFKQGHSQVKDAKGQLDKLQKEYDTIRHQGKEAQMKLKRELQTALNRLETVESR